jgi:hypothetical protein
MSARTAKAEAFIAANAKSPVVAGAATHRGRACPENVTGCRYTLDDGQVFTLTSAELRSMPEPRWRHVA